MQNINWEHQPFTDDTCVNTQSTQHITFTSFYKFYFLPKGCRVSLFTKTSNNTLS